MERHTELDPLDHHLLTLLQDDCQLSIQQLAERTGASGTTCHRRIKALEEAGFIERRVAILSFDKLKAAGLVSLQALVEVTLEPQTAENMARFQAAAVADAAVQACWRTASGPDFMLLLLVADMAGYQAVAQRLFTNGLCVRNVRTFFATERAKFLPGMPLPKSAGAPH
jgi:Lrp/AsnC family transcriptional regulator, leucine-responsive regulatory protein